MKINKILKIFGCIVIVTGFVFAGVRGPNYEDIRSMGMGNTTVAVTTDRTAIFHNPAGLSLLRDKVEVSISPLVFSIDGDVGKVIRAMSDHGTKLTDMSLIDDEFIDMINELDGEWVGFEFLPEVTIASNNIGFGMYSTFPIGMRIESGHLIPKLGLRGQRDLVFTWAVGVPLKTEKIRMGISVEYLQRTPVEEVITSYSETFNYFDQISTSGGMLGIVGDLGNVQHGVSFDVGFMHDFDGFRIAYDVKDILGVIGGKIVAPPQLDFGFAYYFPQIKDVKYIDNLILAIEFSDIFGFEPVSRKYEHPLKKLHLGGELDLHYAAFRFGFNQGYPTAGLGLRFGVFHLDYVFYTKELGYYPGQYPKRKHVLSISAGFDVARPPRESERTGAANPEVKSGKDEEQKKEREIKTNSEDKVQAPVEQQGEGKVDFNQETTGSPDNSSAQEEEQQKPDNNQEDVDWE